MRRLIVGVVLVSLNCTVILAQQNDKSNSKPPTPLPPIVLAAGNPSAGTSFQLPRPPFTFGQAQTVNSGIRASSDSAKQVGPFVVLDGAVYMRMPGGPFLLPVSGGGASGCFSLDLPQRIENLKEFVPKLKSLGQNF
jgi:hypothetical protein